MAANPSPSTPPGGRAVTRPQDALPAPDVYFDPPGKCYFVRNDRANFIAVSEGNLKRMLKAQGFSNEVSRGELVSVLDRTLNEVQTTRDVDYAGPLAGYKTEVYKMENRRVLVTEPPVFIEAEDGPWPTLRKFVENLLGEKQAPHFYGWMRCAMLALRSGKRRPGQVLVLAGPAGCGKSLLQNFITKLLGGRSAKPYQYMTGGTQFNSELFHAEHLMVEDEAASFNLQVRRQFGRNLNAFVVNESQRCHPKNRPAMTLFPFWRVSVTLNDEAENLMVLPPMEDSLREKMMLLRAEKKEMPMPTETLEQWGAFMQVMTAELGCFAWWLLKVFQVPEGLVDERFGVRYFHNEELLQMMSVLAPETKLMELVDLLLFPKGKVLWEAWEGKASDLESKLCAQGSGVEHEARKLMYYNSACGQYLGRLARVHQERIKSRTRDGYTIWMIEPPARVREE